jgi:hypothetical protein
MGSLMLSNAIDVLEQITELVDTVEQTAPGEGVDFKLNRWKVRE